MYGAMIGVFLSGVLRGRQTCEKIQLTGSTKQEHVLSLRRVVTTCNHCQGRFLHPTSTRVGKLRVTAWRRPAHAEKFRYYAWRAPWNCRVTTTERNAAWTHSHTRTWSVLQARWAKPHALYYTSIKPVRTNRAFVSADTHANQRTNKQWYCLAKAVIAKFKHVACTVKFRA